jgi:DNA-binding response OmpR family regulator
VNQPDLSSAHFPSRDLQVLILEPDERVAMEIVAALEEAAPGTRARVARSLGEGQRFVVDQKPLLFVLDVDATYDMAQEFIYDLRTSHPNARAIILTAIHFTADREQMAGLGAIHYLEKPFPRADFITLVEALLAPAGEEAPRFQGTLSDLHVADIIQLKCISGATSMLEFTGPRGEKARVYFEQGQVRHAVTGDKQGLEAFNQIVDWQGGKISEVPVPHGIPRTIDLDWQVLLMEAVRKMDENRGAQAQAAATEATRNSSGHKLLVIDDSVMLLSFVKEILEEKGYSIVTAENGEDGLRLCAQESPDLVLLDFVLPDMKGDEVCRRLLGQEATAKVPVVYVSGFGSDLSAHREELPNIIGVLNKPFTSEALISAVEEYLEGKEPSELPAPVVAPREVAPAGAVTRRSPPIGEPVVSNSLGASNGPRPVETPRPATSPTAEITCRPDEPARDMSSVAAPKPEAISTPPKSIPAETPAPAPAAAPGDAYFCGDSSFFSLHWALQTVEREKLSGILRAFWSRDSVELLAREGKVVLVTTRNPSLYCEEAPVTLLNVAAEQIERARERQSRDGSPLFLTLANEGLILREPGLQLIQHYGQRLFSQLWTDRVRFMFVPQALPDYSSGLPAVEDKLDQWALSTLRFVQYQQLAEHAVVDPGVIPAYTRNGFERVQELRLTVAEAQFASQFNGSRSVAQISKNLRLDIKFARLTLFRFVALEIVECWPAELGSKPESRGGLRGLFGR